MQIAISFKEWIQLRIPNEIITNLGNANKNTILLVFKQI